MKKIIQIILLIFLLKSVSAQTGNVGIGTATPNASAELDITSTNSGILIPRVALTATNAAGPITSPEPSLLVYNTATAGIAPINVTPGYYYNAGTAATPNWVRLINTGNGKANNGLSVDNDTVKLGGTLIQNTTITQGTNNMVYNLNGTGDFDIQDNGTSAFFVRDDGNVGINTNNPGAKLHVMVPADNNNNPDGNGVYVYNAGNAGDNDDAIIAARVLGANAGDPFFSLDIDGVTGWSMGIDNSDADKLKFANSWSDPGTNTRMSIATNGEVTINNLAGTNTRAVTANNNGTLETKENSLWTISSNMASSPDDLSGGDLTVDGDDDRTILRDLGFTVVINGISYTQVSICTNGWIAFGNITNTAWDPTALPVTFTNNPLIMPYFSDLKDFGTGEWIREYKPSNNLYILEWRMRAFTNGSTNWVVRFQVQIHKTGLINVKYFDPMTPQLNGQQHIIDGLTRNTVIGFQTDGGANAKYHQISYNAKVMDDNNESAEGWSVSPAR